MSYNKEEIVKGLVTGIQEYGAFVKLGDGSSGLIHYSQIPCLKGEVGDNFKIGDEISVMILGNKGIDRYGKERYDLSIKKIKEQEIKEQVKQDIKDLEGEEKDIREIWKIFTEINKCLLQYMRQPLLLNPKSIKIKDASKKLSVRINTESKIKLFEKSFKEKFHTELIPINENAWSFYAPIDSISPTVLKSFGEECEYLYMNFFQQPFVEGEITGFKANDKKEIEERLQDYCPNIVLSSPERGKIVFRQSYLHHPQQKEWQIALNGILEEIKSGTEYTDEETNEEIKLRPIQLEYSLSNPTEEDKFLIERDVFGQTEHESIVISALKGESFSCNNYEFGILSKVDYPTLTFTINDESIQEVKKLVEEGLFTKVSTDMTGDSEKINRLRESFDFITENPDQLRNPKLAIYLFDASKAGTITSRQIANREKRIKDNQLNKQLNDSQIEAIAKAVEAPDLALIQGPPGTGKSTAIAELIWQLALNNPNKHILLTSEANLAVDNALDRLKFSVHNIVKPIRIGAGDRVSSEGLPYTITELKKWAGIDFSANRIQKEDNDLIEASEEYHLFDKSNIVLNRWMHNIYKRSNIQNSFVRKMWYDYLYNLPFERRKKVYWEYINHCNVIGATCSSIAEKSFLAIENKSKNVESKFFKRYKAVFPKAEHIDFDTVVQDEASKATPAELSLPLIYGRKSVIIGDHRQLPPNIDREDILYKLHYQGLQSVDTEEKEQIERLEKFVRYHFDQLEKSHFERLFTQADESIKGTFHLQYRMHPDINNVIEQFYKKDGGLECGFKNYDYEAEENPFSRYHGIEIEGLISPNNHVIWIDTNSPEIANGTTRENIGEVEAVNWVLESFANSQSFQSYNEKMSSGEDKEIGVITFYGGQLKLLRRLQAKYSGKLTLKTSSVDRFQGMERNIVIVSLVRSNCIAEKPNQAPDFRVYKELGYRRQRDFGFAKSPNRLNVALSRAKRLLIIIGNKDHYCSYKNKEGEFIYKNVFDSIKNNPNGRIIEREYRLMKKKPITISKDRSANLNTRDINPETDKQLRVIDTWFNPNANKENPKIAVLELSTKAVKCLMGDQYAITHDSRFNFKNFIRNANKTETGKGLNAENEMSMKYFRNRVLPTIISMKRLMLQNNVDVVYSVATAAYRTAKNRDEIIEFIRKQAGINVRILSKKEESIATLYAYMFSTAYKEEMLKAPHLVMIDQGGGSTEVSVFENNVLKGSYSINLGTTALRNILFLDSEMDTPITEALKRSDAKIRERLTTFYKNMDQVMQSETESFCISVGTAITHATGGKNNAAQHDRIMTKEKIEEKIEECTQHILEQFDTVGDLNEFDFEASKGNKKLDDYITMRLGLPMFLSLMERFNIMNIHVCGTGLWYGIYLQHLYKIAD